MKTPMEISLERIKFAIEGDYIKIEALKNRIDGMKAVERHVEDAIRQEQKDKKSASASISGVGGSGGVYDGGTVRLNIDSLETQLRNG